MDQLFSSLETRLTYIENNTDNSFITSKVNIIRAKASELKSRKYSHQESVDYVCDSIINKDIALMKGVTGLTNMVYKKMDEVVGFVNQIRDQYMQ